MPKFGSNRLRRILNGRSIGRIREPVYQESVHFAVELSALVRPLQDNYQDLDGVLRDGLV